MTQSYIILKIPNRSIVEMAHHMSSKLLISNEDKPVPQNIPSLIYYLFKKPIEILFSWYGLWL